MTMWSEKEINTRVSTEDDTNGLPVLIETTGCTLYSRYVKEEHT